MITVSEEGDVHGQAHRARLLDNTTATQYFVIRVWWASIVEGDPQPLEDHDELCWLDRNALYAVSWLPADLPIVRAAEARLGAPA